MSNAVGRSKFFSGELYPRMSDDLQLAGMSERTVAGYLRAVRLGRSGSQSSTPESQSIAGPRGTRSNQRTNLELHLRALRALRG